jgi:hypothetical protein
MKSFVSFYLALLVASLVGPPKPLMAAPSSAATGTSRETNASSPAATRGLAEPAPAPGKRPRHGPFLPYINPLTESAIRQYLPDTTLLAQVDSRVVDAEELRLTYFNGDFTVRSSSDSAGRVEFLNSMVNKDVLGLTARSVNVPLDFGDRANLREYTNVVLQNALYQFRVADSITVTEQDLAELMPQFGRELLLREIPFDDKALAERVRLDLLRGRTTWAEADKQYSGSSSIVRADTLVGWKQRGNLSGVLAIKIFALKPGPNSVVVQDVYGYHVVQVVQERPVDPPPLVFMRRMLIRDLREAKSGVLVEKMYAEAAARAHAVYDSTNIRWLAEHFRRYARSQTLNTEVINLSPSVPTVAPVDTGRILMRMKSRNVSVNQFLHEYRNIPPIQRHRLVSLEPVIFTLNGMFLAPELVALAREDGLDKVPEVTEQLDERREKLMVERMYQDSVMSRVRVTADDRRKYFDQHRQEFRSPATVRYAYVLRYEQAGMDSVVDALEHGASPLAIVHQDSLKGYVHSGTEVIRQGQNHQYAKVLFEELRPGQFTKVGPDFEGKYLLIAKIEQREERLLSYEEAEQAVDDATQAVVADRLLKDLLERQRRKHKVVMRPELVMRIRFSDPMLD